MAGDLMKALTAPPFGGPEVLTLVNAPRPIAGPEELLVRVAAIGVNRVDAMQRAGIYPPPPGAGPILGVEFAGEVVATGPAVTGFKRGDRVFCLVSAGAYAEYATVHQGHAVLTPAGWDDVKAAAVIETFCTAHETLFELGRLKAEERVLIHAAGSAVGSTAIQMAVHAGATVIGTAGAAAKIQGALKLGAAHVIDYKSKDFATEIERLYPDGVDLVEDFVGSTYFQQHLHVLRWRGRMVLVGLLGPAGAEINTAPILSKRLSVMGFTLRPQSIEEKAAIVARFRARWLGALVEGAVAPVMHAVLPFERADDAHRILENNENFGKVVLTVS